MVYDENHKEELKSWITEKVKSIRSQDPESMADFIINLLDQNKSKSDLKPILSENLNDYLGNDTDDFVNQLVDALDNRTYLITSATNDTNHQSGNDANADGEKHTKTQEQEGEEIAKDNEYQTKPKFFSKENFKRKILPQFLFNGTAIVSCLTLTFVIVAIFLLIDSGSEGTSIQKTNCIVVDPDVDCVKGIELLQLTFTDYSCFAKVDLVHPTTNENITVETSHLHTVTSETGSYSKGQEVECYVDVRTSGANTEVAYHDFTREIDVVGKRTLGIILIVVPVLVLALFLTLVGIYAGYYYKKYSLKPWNIFDVEAKLLVEESNNATTPFQKQTGILYREGERV